MSRGRVKVLCGIPFQVRAGQFRARLPLADLAIKPGPRPGTFRGFINGGELSWEYPAPATAEVAADRLLAAVRRRAALTSEALSSIEGPAYIFTKSGSHVRVVGEAEPYQGQPCVTVRRIGTGKEMVVPVEALALRRSGEVEDAS